jgi:sugar lactone lactonase YvrE
MQVEQVTDPVAYRGEGPVWSARWGGLRWVDMLAGDVLSLSDDGIVGRRHVGTVAAALRPRHGGGAVIGVERGFVLEGSDGSLTPLPELWSGDEVRMNEGACDPDGRFYCGSTAYDQRPGAASLYRLDADLTVHVVLDDITVSNGLEWSPDDSRAYYNDTATHRISVFGYDPESGSHGPANLRRDSRSRPPRRLDRRLRGRRVDRHLQPGRRAPVHARWPPRGGAQGSRAQGHRLHFRGEQLNELFITTSRERLPEGEDPLGRSLFRSSPQIAGLPVREFAG